MKYKLLIVLFLLSTTITSVIIINKPKNEYIGTWENIVILDSMENVPNETQTTTFTLKNNGEVYWEKHYTNNLGDFYRKGAWEEYNDTISIIFNDYGGKLKLEVKKISNNKLCIDYQITEEKCIKYQIYKKK